MKKSCETRLNISKEDRSLILRRGRQTIRRATARLPKVFKIPEPARNCQRRVNEGHGHLVGRVEKRKIEVPSTFSPPSSGRSLPSAWGEDWRARFPRCWQRPRLRLSE